MQFAEADFFDKLGIAQTVETAFRLACRHGYEAALPERGYLTPREGLQALGRILAWTERKAKQRPGNFLTPPQAARKLGVSPDTVRGWIASDELRAVNVARPGKRASHRISLEALAEFERRRQTKVVKPAARRRKAETLLVERY
ncbi:MAG TPA: helix-turn-helix domain-containing protein [Pirellulales bacterium]|nr:helix-turn-helix domain-containing protein [Pirellulales bacterium]